MVYPPPNEQPQQISARPSQTKTQTSSAPDDQDKTRLRVDAPAKSTTSPISTVRTKAPAEKSAHLDHTSTNTSTIKDYPNSDAGPKATNTDREEDSIKIKKNERTFPLYDTALQTQPLVYIPTASTQPTPEPQPQNTDINFTAINTKNTGQPERKQTIPT